VVRDFNRVDSCFAGSNILRDLCLKGRGRLDWRPLSVHPLDLILTSHCESTPGASRIAPVANENLKGAAPPLTRHSSCIKIAAAPRKHWCSKGRLRRTFKPGKGAPGRPRLSASTACVLLHVPKPPARDDVGLLSRLGQVLVLRSGVGNLAFKVRCDCGAPQIAHLADESRTCHRSASRKNDRNAQGNASACEAQSSWNGHHPPT